MNFETSKYLIICNNFIENNLFISFCDKFHSEFHLIDEFFHIDYPQLMINLVTKPQIDIIAKTKGTSYKNVDVPASLNGFSTFQEVYVVQPNENNLYDAYKTALHEVVHLISYHLSTQKKRIKLLDEGIAIYLSNQYEGHTFSPWVNAYLKNTLPNLSDFCTYDSLQFGKNGGYRYSYCIVEYLINSYGKEQYLEWLQDSDSFLKESDKIGYEFHQYIIKKIEARIK